MTMENKFYLSVQDRDSYTKSIHRSSKNSFTMKNSVHFNAIEPENYHRVSRNSIKLPTKKAEKTVPKRQAFKNKTVINHSQAPEPE